MNNLEYSFIIAELSPLVIDKHFSRIRKIDDRSYRMKIGNIEIICELGIRLHKTKYLEESELTDKFVQKIEKELDNAKLLSIEQIAKDRIVSFNFNKGKLIFEMFGNGNAILVLDGKTVTASKYESWAGREIKPGSEYNPPTNTPSDDFVVSDKYIIVSLMKLPLGKEYALEALELANINERTSGTSLTKTQLSLLVNEVSNIRKSMTPCLFYKNSKPVDFCLCKMKQYNDLECRVFPTLSDALDEYYSNLEQPNLEFEKLEKRLEKQYQHRESLVGEEKSNKEIGDYLYAHYDKIEELITLAKQDQDKYKVNKKEKSFEIEL